MIGMTHPDTPAGALRALVAEAKPSPAAIAALLDGLDHDSRVSALLGLRRNQLQDLFQIVAGGSELALDHLVPAPRPEGSAVRHIGRNSLPLFSEFEKRFYRTEDGTVAGANFQTMSPITGPGYFVARQAPSHTEILIDYEQLPQRTPEGWPVVRSNERGISRFVYGHMIDTLRRVSRHVSVGAASRHGQAPEAYFTLCRYDAS